MENSFSWSHGVFFPLPLFCSLPPHMLGRHSLPRSHPDISGALGLPHYSCLKKDFDLDYGVQTAPVPGQAGAQRQKWLRCVVPSYSPDPRPGLLIRVSSSKLLDEDWTRIGRGLGSDARSNQFSWQGREWEPTRMIPAKHNHHQPASLLKMSRGTLLWLVPWCLKIRAYFTAEAQKADSLHLFGSASENRRPSPTHPKKSLFCPYRALDGARPGCSPGPFKSWAEACYRLAGCHVLARALEAIRAPRRRARFPTGAPPYRSV